MIDTATLHARIASRAEDYLRELFGDKFDKAAHGTFRVGSKGSLAVSVKDGALVYFSHEEGTGGDAIALWQRERGGTAGEALRGVAAWAGVVPTPNGNGATATPHKAKASNGTHAPAPADWSNQWAACVTRATDERLAPIAAERGISLAFLRYAVAHGWLGFYGANVAFPVVNGAGTTVACHYRLPDRSWRYEPTGQGTHPLVIGDPRKTGIAWAFESQWDALAALDALAVHEDADSFTNYFAVIVTRGAGNGALATKAAAGCNTLVAWPQNDPANPKTGKVPSEDWMQAIAATAAAGVTVRRVQTPQEHEDAAAWCKAAHPSRDVILAAVTDAAQIEAPAPEAATASNGSAPAMLATINGKPALQLPGDGRPLGDFAEDCGRMLAAQSIFARKGCAFTLNPEGQKLEPATPTWLRSWAERHVCCYKSRTSNGQEMRLASTMTEDAARVVLVAPQFLENLRRVERFHPCHLPVIRRNAAIELLPEGHDAESATYTAPGSPYPLDMTAEDARQVIEDAFAEFPFADDAGRSKAVAVAALLTVYAGGIMAEGSTRPVFLYLGNAEGTGKTTAARLAGICYGAVAAESAPTEESEWQKKLLSAVIGGRRLLLLDNLKGNLNSPSLEAYTTASRYSGRILGVSREFEGEACASVLITGNRLTVSPDMRRRALIVELFMHELRAEDRHFSRRLDDPALLALRPRLLAACWALVKAWDIAGRPGAARMNSSFPRWCDTIGGIVEHAGFACPTAPAELDGMGDTDTRDIAKLAAEITPGTRYTFSEVADLCAEHGLFERFTNDREKDGELTRRAKSSFAKTLKQYDRRTIAQRRHFIVEGDGHARRYLTR